MKCVNHSDRESVAFCQHCGKPLCDECIRKTGSSVFCAECWTSRTGTAVPPTGFGPGAAGYPPVGAPIGTREPSPGLAALLGFIPGVGAMYNGQYAKGFIHLIIFAVLVSLADVNDIFGLFIAGWILYMVIEAHHTASARRDGAPLPDPFGLNELSDRMGWGRRWTGAAWNWTAYGTPRENPPASSAAGSNTPPANPNVPPYNSYSYSVPPVPPMPGYCDPSVPNYRRFPAGAIWLILLGVFFLVENTGFFHFIHRNLFMPILLIGLGVWVFVRKMTCSGHGLENDGTEFYRWRLGKAIRSSFFVILVGVIWLLDSLHILSWGHSWPLFLIGAGVMSLFRHTLNEDYGYGGYGAAPGPVASAPPVTPVPGSGLAPVDPLQEHISEKEGR